MEYDTSERYYCLAHDCSREEKLHEGIVLRNTKNRFQSSWRILNFSGMYIQIETFMYTIMSYKKWGAKYQTEMLLCTRIAKTAIRVKSSNYK